ncbi:MAG: hypothetical protein IIC97_02045 [Chloroflexi bacterium]|nr:hypothetical protein [Chloroflexota bacterium]
MMHRITRLAVAVVALLALAGCEAVKEVAGEGAGVIKNGKETQGRGESALEEKNRAIDLDL